MNSLSFQRLQNQLKGSFDRIPTNPVVFGWRERQFLNLIQNNPIFSTLLMELEQEHGNVVEKTKEVLNQQDIDVRQTLPIDVDKHAASSLSVVRYCLAKQKPWSSKLETQLAAVLRLQPQKRCKHWNISFPYTYTPFITISAPSLKTDKF